MARVPVLALVPPIAFGLLAGLFFVGMGREDADTLPSTLIGKPVPAVAETSVGGLPTFGAAELAAPGLKLVNFWASWCAPCRAEHPTLIELGKDIPIYGVNQDVTEADAMGFLDELGNPFAGVVQDRTKRQSIEWGVYGLPETFLVDGQGVILARIVGPLTQRVLKETLRPAMDEAAGR